MSPVNLLTAQELADVLKMNAQVVARKLSSGEIEGYKLGKEWRVSEAQLMRYLEKNSNARPADPQAKLLKSYFTEGKLKEIPAARGKRVQVLRYLVSQLEEQRVYSEPEINAFLKKFHPDACTLRREFIMNKLMVRKDGKYKRVAWNA